MKNLSRQEKSLVAESSSSQASKIERERKIHGTLGTKKTKDRAAALPSRTPKMVARSTSLQRPKEGNTILLKEKENGCLDPVPQWDGEPEQVTRMHSGTSQKLELRAEELSGKIQFTTVSSSSQAEK
jgi:hypothetical protein